MASGCDFQIVAAPRILVSSVDVDVMSFVGLVYLAVGIFDRSRRERLHDALLARIFERVVAVFEEIVPLTVVVDRSEDELFEERDVELVREGEVAFLARVFERSAVICPPRPAPIGEFLPSWLTYCTIVPSGL